MEKELQTLADYVLFYLNRIFRVEGEHVYNDDGKINWASDVINEIVNVFGFNRESVTQLIQEWTEARGIVWSEFGATRKINCRWTPEMAADIAAYHNIDAEAELTALLSEHIGREIDVQILNNITNFQQLERQMLNIGYKKNTIIDPNTFEPIYQFISNSE